MNAILPLNIAALRVSANDGDQITPSFIGSTVQFEDIPWMSPTNVGIANSGGNPNQGQSIQDIYRGLEGGNGGLHTGMHLHWELPNYFRNGRQNSTGGAIEFPHAPNRWLVVRHFRLFDANTKQYGSVYSKGWVVESDYIRDSADDEQQRVGITVPLPATPAYKEQPYKFMGRVVDLEKWTASTTNAHNYLPNWKDEQGKPYYLTALGFVGPHFSAYYPECRTVFGFWDRFDDLTQVEGVNVFNAIKDGQSLKFKVTYQVIGWISDEQADPFASQTILKAVKQQYAQLSAACQKEKVALKKTPGEVLIDHLQSSYRWSFRGADVEHATSIDQLEVPARCLCNGWIQEIVWDQTQDPKNCFFQQKDITSEVKVAIGNTTTEALAALIKHDVSPDNSSQDLLQNIEFLLDALQSGWLNRLERNNGLFQLQELLHNQSFTQLDGGLSWVIAPKGEDLPTRGNSSEYQRPEQKMALPPALALQLNKLNQAQKKYDQGRQRFETKTRQVFMDWVQKMKASESKDWGDLETNFLMFVPNSIDALQKEQAAVGLLQIKAAAPTQQAGQNAPLHTQDLAPIIPEPTAKSSLAHQVWEQFYQLLTALKNFPGLQLHFVPNSTFQVPNDPVLVLEGADIEPQARNGYDRNLACRFSNELVNRVDIQYNGQSTSIDGGQLVRLSLSNLPAGIDQLLQEVFLLVPMLADALKGKLSGPDSDGILTQLQRAQGGSLPANANVKVASLYQAVHLQKTPADPKIQVGNNTYTFTSTAQTAQPPSPIGWSLFEADKDKQSANFLPLFLHWNVTFDPLKWKNISGFQYDENNLKDYFELGEDRIDYQLKANTPFTNQNPVPYTGSIPLSRNVTKSLTTQIQNYLDHYPDDPAKGTLTGLIDKLQPRKMLAQSLSGFTQQLVQVERYLKLKAQNLMDPESDQITFLLQQAISGTAGDGWYQFNCNNQLPIQAGPRAANNFSPLRAGWMEIKDLKIVDVFGREMALHSPGQAVLESSETIMASSLQSAGAPAGKVFLPPRLNMPTRLWFRWLSAQHNTTGKTPAKDVVEMNSHPETTPIFGCVVPNHLDNALFFYTAEGHSIGSFGVAHEQLVYRTTPGNTSNPQDELQTDIGAKGSPKIDPHLAKFMWFLHDQPQPATFLQAMLESIEKTNQHISPARAKENTDLAVLLGRPLVLSRAVIGLETKGTTTPMLQSWKQFQDDMNNTRDFQAREQQNSGNITAVDFPVQLGNLSAINDSLIGYLIDSDTGYEQQTFYTAAVGGSKVNHIQHPAADTLQLQLNATPKTLTLLMDPRGPVHATTGILPVQQLDIPSEQYVTLLQKLAMTFQTHPVLQPAAAIALPYPVESEYDWSWITLQEDATAQEQALSPDEGETNQAASGPSRVQPVSEQAFYAYSPQRLQEGWLQLRQKSSKQ